MSLSPDLIAARRFGYGPAATGPQDAATLLRGLQEGDAMAASHPVAGVGEVAAAAARAVRLRQERKRGGGDRARENEAKAEIGRMAQRVLVAALARISASPTPFRERLVWFWADHFTVVRPNGELAALPGAFIDEAVRPRLSGSFADLLTAAVTHPAMILYLDQSASVGPDSAVGKRTGKGLNENLAREVLELHTLGAGSGYTQQDVREFAELLTGLTVQQGTGTIYRDRAAEPGAETVLGVTYDQSGMAAIREALTDLAVRPETARHIARKLAIHFVSDDPPAELVAQTADAYAATGGDLLAAYAALLDHPAAWSPRFRKVRQPLDYVGAALRALAVVPQMGTVRSGRRERPVYSLLGPALAGMGQKFLSAPGPNGWPEEAAYWLTPQGLAARIDWALEVPKRLVPDLPPPETFARRAVGDDETAVIEAARRAETASQAVGLVLASPAFMRR